MRLHEKKQLTFISKVVLTALRSDVVINWRPIESVEIMTSAVKTRTVSYLSSGLFNYRPVWKRLYKAVSPYERVIFDSSNLLFFMALAMRVRVMWLINGFEVYCCFTKSSTFLISLVRSFCSKLDFYSLGFFFSRYKKIVRRILYDVLVHTKEKSFSTLIFFILNVRF